MISFFTPVATDQSLYYLGYIFGSVGNVLTPTGTTAGGSTVGLMSIMFGFLNSMALTIGAAIVIYTIVVGLLKTAHEGKFLGQHWDSLWVPIRTVLGIAALFPTATGYCAIQVVFMWIIIQGIGAADTLWTTVLNYVSTTGSPYNTISIPNLAVNTKFQNLFQALVCQASAAQTGQLGTTQQTGSTTPTNTYLMTESGVAEGNPTKYFYCGDQPADDAFCTSHKPDQADSWDLKTTQDTADGTVLNIGPGGSCGKLVIHGDFKQDTLILESGSNTTGLKNALRDAQKTSLLNIVPVLNSYAVQVAQADLEYLKFGVLPPLGPSGREKQSEAPQWISDFCTATDPTQPCCYQHDQTTCRSTVFSGYGYNSSSAPLPWTSVDSKTMQSLYWPYYIKPKLTITNSKGEPFVSNFIQASVDQYATDMGKALHDFFANNKTSLSEAWQTDAKSNGWVLAGGYYFKMANNTQHSTAATMPSFEVTGGDPSDPDKSASNVMNRYRNNYSAAGTLNTLVQQQGSTTTDTGETKATVTSSNNYSDAGVLAPALSKISSAESTAGSQILDSFQNTLTGGRRVVTTAQAMIVNPLANIQQFGEELLDVADTLFGVFLLGFIILIMTGGWNPIILGESTGNPLSSAAMVAALILLPPFIAFLGAVYTFGGLLAVYTPLIPYIIFSMGALGWMIATIEAMVAAPLVALGIMNPGGDHEILGSARHSIMMLFNLFLRPSLMVFGLVASMFVSGAAVTMINAGFSGMLDTMMPSGGPGLTELILFIAAYIFVILAILNKVFTLIYVIPQQVLVWIGGSPVSYGEGEALGGVERGISGAAGAVGAATAAAPSATQAGASSSLKGDKADAKAKAQGEAQATNIAAALKKGEEGGGEAKKEGKKQ